MGIGPSQPVPEASGRSRRTSTAANETNVADKGNKSSTAGKSNTASKGGNGENTKDQTRTAPGSRYGRYLDVNALNRPTERLQNKKKPPTMSVPPMKESLPYGYWSDKSKRWVLEGTPCRFMHTKVHDKDFDPRPRRAPMIDADGAATDVMLTRARCSAFNKC
ncbi:MAG: hypothetical protein ABEI52_06780, partial [Halobacteriaceae archaeon]